MEVDLGAGDDVVDASLAAVNVTARGGEGADAFHGGAGRDTFLGGPGENVVSYALAPAGVIVDLRAGVAQNDGHGNRDVLAQIRNVIGSPFADRLVGDGWGNVLDGGAGSDWVYGHSGDDVLSGGQGDDVLNGGAGRDFVSYLLDPGPVVVDLGIGMAVDGWGDGDSLAAVEGIIGSAFDDELRGNAQRNTFVWSAGDVIDGGGGRDILEARGTDLAEVFTIGMVGGMVYLDRGVGDAATVGAAGPWHIHLDTGGGDDRVIVENLTGSGVVLVEVDLGAGDDRLDGSRGTANVIARGGLGDDVFQGGAGRDVFIGGPGQDRIDYSAAPGGVVVTLAGQIANRDGYGNTDAIVQIEHVTGSAFDDRLFGDAADNVLEGLAGDDVLYGRCGADLLAGGAGDDIIYAMCGDDVVAGGEGADWVYGGTGDDRIYGGPGNDYLDGQDGDDFLFGEAGEDTLIGNFGDDQLAGGADKDSLCGWYGDDVLHGGGGDDRLDGQYGSDRLFGDDGADRLIGGLGDDELYGGLGDDRLDGEAGNDRLYGWEGDDTLIGGPGNDELYGDFGDDTLDGGPGGDLLVGGRGTNAVIDDKGPNTIDEGRGAGFAEVDDGPVEIDLALTAVTGVTAAVRETGQGLSRRQTLGAEALIFGQGDGTIDDLTVSIEEPPQRGEVTLDGWIATYTPDESFAGSDRFTFTVTNPRGDSVTIAVDLVLPPADIVFAPGQPAVITDADGTRVGVYLSSGEGGLYLGVDGNIRLVALTPAAAWTRLVVTTDDGGDGEATVGGMLVDGSILSIAAPTTDFVGDRITVSGWLGSIELDDVAEPHAIVIGGGVQARGVQMRFDEVFDLSVTSKTPIALFAATNVSDTDGVADRIRAPWLTTLIVRGDVGFDLDLYAADAGGYALRTATIFGDILGGLWDLAGRLGRLHVGGTAKGTQGNPLIVRTAGSMDSLTADAFEYANFLAGMTAAGDHATDFAQFGDAAIGVLTILGKKTPAAPSMVASHFSAAKFGQVTIVNPDTAGGDLGLWCRDSVTDDELRLMIYRDFLAAEIWTYSTLWAAPYPGDPGFFNIIYA